MKQRVITGVLGGGVLLLILLAPSAILKITIGIVSLIALYELYHTVGLNRCPCLIYAGLLFAAASVWGALYMPKAVPFLFFVYIAVLFFLMLANYEQIHVSDIALNLFLNMYVVYALMYIIWVRDGFLGNINIFLIIIGAFAADSCAYFTGSFLGKHKLCPHISPKKTVEGAIGGIAGDILFYFILAAVVKVIYPEVRVNPLCLGVLGLLCGVVSEIGDLAASAIKRQYNVKDFGHLLPGHGGIMDRLDSILFISPLVYYFILYFPVFY